MQRMRGSRLPFMDALAKAFVELAAYLEDAKFDDPDEEQGAREAVGRCLANATPEEKAMIAGVARQFAKEAEQSGLPEHLIRFYHSLSHWTRRPL